MSDFMSNIYPYHVIHSTSSQLAVSPPVVSPSVTQHSITYEEDEPDPDASTQTQTPTASPIPPRKSTTKHPGQTTTSPTCPLKQNPTT